MFPDSTNAYLGSTTPRRAGRAQLLMAGVTTLACLALPLPAAAEPTSACATASQTVIVRQFDRWNHALATGNPDAVARFYAEDAVLQVSPSVAPLVGRAAIRAYIAGILPRHPQGTLSSRSISVRCNAASDTGTYVYRLTGKRKGTRMLLAGRYSTFYEYRDGDWLIVRHHHQPSPHPTSVLPPDDGHAAAAHT
jgi:uncharacterized protein (TIGR02246 family)